MSGRLENTVISIGEIIIKLPRDQMPFCRKAAPFLRMVAFREIRWQKRSVTGFLFIHKEENSGILLL